MLHTANSVTCVYLVSQILEKEISHLEKLAGHVNPDTNRYEAASIKLLASTLMNLDGDEPADDDYDSLAPGRGDVHSGADGGIVA